jgi:hypothetical protein
MSDPATITNTLIELLKSKKNEETNTSWLVSNLPTLMSAVEQASKALNLSGADKKQIVISAISAYINLEEDEHDEAALYFTESVLPILIDTLVLVDTKQLRIKARKMCTKCTIL